MRIRSIFVPIIILIVIVSTFVAVKAHRTPASSDDLLKFLQLREQINAYFQEQALIQLPGVKSEGPANEAEAQFQLKQWPPDEHIVRVHSYQKDWHGTQDFRWIVNLETSPAPQKESDDPDRCDAQVILDHLFADLEKLGLKRIRTFTTKSNHLQYVGADWVSEEPGRICVTGTVSLSLDAHEGIIHGSIREYFPKD